ncbi:ATP-binding protein [Flavobacterium hiemivividum]|uniref:Sensory/regulatory protein RpfC n=1 Tax=Flavobacterium hiemivividum TaxID=2541734 RepID=A0A4R5CTB2_9FLAO|nr:ATP-binding protein [Flavobacterium hiemivividum]TDE02640.1 response regulator [Flavobacterium hiemivividum]
MRLISEKRFQIYYILVAIILVAVLGVFYYNNLKLKSTSDSAVHAHEVLRKNDNILLDILDIETGVRGYIISENDLYIESYNKAVKAMSNNLSDLSVLTQSNTEQNIQVDSLKMMTAKKLFLLQKIIDDKKVDLLAENEKIAILEDGKVITDSIKSIIFKINVDEYTALKLKKSENENSAQYSEILFFLLLILIFVIFTLVFIIVKNLKIRNDELELFTSSQKLLSNYSLSLIEASLDPLITINIKGKITDMNEATVKITGVEREKLIGSDFFEYFTEPKMAREVYKEVFAAGSVADSPLTIRHVDGKLTDVLFNGSVYKDPQGKVLGIVIVARDTSEQKRIETELIEAKVFAELATGIAEEEKRIAENATLIAENAVKAKQQFLSNMSHEIRTPMNAIIGFTKVVLKTDLTTKQKEYLDAIKMSGDALIVLINDILDLAKVDAGKMSFEKTPFKMKASIASMLHLFETKIQEKNLQLIKEYDSNIPTVLIGDPIRLHQIILNLVSNAVKFTSKGKITVNVRLVDQDTENVTIEFAVSDTGIGIPKEKLTTIFENFQQASSGTSRIYGGTGLGLAIVKQLVEPQGGSIKVESIVDEGTTFSFRLKFEKTNAEAELETEILEVDKQPKIIKVLVVEDIALNQLLMKTLLDDFGFERDIAENGKIAIDKLQNNSYDVILMDLQMPEMNGFEATEYIRKTMNSDIPIIALTADVTTVDLAKCKAVGMNDYIAKPVDERLLYSKIVSIVRKYTSKKEKEIKQITMPKTQKYVDLSYLESRTKSNPKLMMEMIAAYLQQTPPLVTAMKESLVNKDWALLRASAHKMVPSFSIMGISPEYEEMAKKIQSYSGDLDNQKEEIDNLVLQLSTICNQACEELEIEFNYIKNKN